MSYVDFKMHLLFSNNSNTKKVLFGVVALIEVYYDGVEINIIIEKKILIW